VVSRQYYDLDAVLEFDALDDFGQLFSPFNRRHVFAAGVDEFEHHELGGLG